MKHFFRFLIFLFFCATTFISCENKKYIETNTNTNDSIQSQPVKKKHSSAEWTIDTSASKIEFTIKNLGKEVKGQFSGFTGKIFFDEKSPEGNSVEISIRVNTLNTGIEKRDKHLRSDKFFDIEKHPLIVYRADSILRTEDAFTALGTLMIKGISKSCDVPFTFGSSGNKNVFSGIVTLHRLDFGVGAKNAIMGNEVKVSFNIVAERK